MEVAEIEGRDSPLEEQIIVFGLHDELFGFRISLIGEITEVVALNNVPKAPGFISGVINYHGKIVSVLSLARFFNIPSHERGAVARIIVLDMPGYSVGLLVDNVKEIASFPVESEGRNPMEGEEFKNIYVEKVLTMRGSLVNMINVKKLLSDLEDCFKEVNVEH